MTQEQTQRFYRQCDLAIKEFQSGDLHAATDRLELLTIFLKEIQKEGDSNK